MIIIAFIVFCLGVIAFPIILLGGFFIPTREMSIILSSDALLVALANLVLQLTTRR